VKKEGRDRARLADRGKKRRTKTLSAIRYRRSGGKRNSYQFSVVSEERKRQSPGRVGVNADAENAREHRAEKGKEKAYAEVTKNTGVAEKRNPRARTLRG